MRPTLPLLLPPPLLLLLLLTASQPAQASEPIELNDSNWNERLLDGGDWLVKFYAPWCPACQHAEPMWREVAKRVASSGVRVAKVDVADNQIVGGMFLVTRLPTFYLLKAGQFYAYDGPKTAESVIEFTLGSGYASAEPLAWYRSPTSLHMRGLGSLLKIVISVKQAHAYFTEEQGLPVGVSIAIIGCLALAVSIGLVIGIVCLCDLAFPPRRPEIDEEPLLAEGEKLGAGDGQSDPGAGDENGEGEGASDDGVRRRANAGDDEEE